MSTAKDNQFLYFVKKRRNDYRIFICTENVYFLKSLNINGTLFGFDIIDWVVSDVRTDYIIEEIDFGQYTMTTSYGLNVYSIPIRHWRGSLVKDKINANLHWIEQYMEFEECRIKGLPI